MDGLFLNNPAIVQEPSKRLLPSRQIIRKNEAVRERAKREKIGGFDELAVQQNEAVLDYLRMIKTGVVWSSIDEDFLKKVQDVSFSFDPDSLSVPFSAPTLFILGRQDSECGYQDAWRILENYPRASFVVLDMAGHLAHAEQPRIWAEMVNEWLDRVGHWTIYHD